MRLLAAVIMLVTSLLAVQARAEDPLDIRLLNGGYSGTTGTALLGIEVAMPKGWHTYWKTAGEGGFPPEIDTSESSNIRSFDLAWPAPERIETAAVPGEPALQTNGYMDRAVLPILVKPADPAKDVAVKLSLRLYACKDYCAAFERKLETTIKPASASASDQRKIAEWLRKVPRASSATLAVEPPEALDDGRLSVTVTSTSPLTNPWLHVSNADNTPYTVEVQSIDPNRALFLVAPQDRSFAKSRTLEFVATADGHAATETYDRPVADAPLSWGIILTAFLGGLILNVMPCVFPVLSLKLMALTSGNVRAARIGFAASSLGIVGSFVLLGGALAAMKAAGTEIGWGIQFQSPVFLATMTAVVLAFALGTAGLFEIALPHAVATRATQLTHGHGFGASLAQGFVATLLATPCSAPFVGTAVGFALAGSTWSILAVFAAMGVGMAAPYLLVSVTPGLSKVVPKPGAWMGRVRSTLSVALFATAGWLVMMLSSTIGDTVVFSILTLAAIVGAVVGWAQRSEMAILAALVFVLPGIIGSVPSGNSDGIAWQSFRPGKIQGLVDQGKTVLVYVTADWCITCKVNDRTTWNEPSTVEEVNQKAIPMKADWTRPDPAISSFLKQHGRFGIPFTVIYGPGRNGTVLPEILTPEEVEKALNS
ncbi:thioredoxin family protein [Pararhizobium sp. BT-229]|uniref:protein-disulfide reductase DsbD family protein n=1 Tax=Pararhizobium sp. BT-229 TaxID=2986923 RepID=UPI0021F6B5BB|nr:thioredoxin family protein [Pararhizobium sp. BT-229]MCV9963995.1 thioredoxin family protein [Pararhizobium sp. BT-229]